MKITVKEYGQIHMEEILPLYEDAGWVNYTRRPEMLKKAYEHSLKVLAAWDEERLVGVLRAVGDGFSILYIQDIIVLQSYRRRGIGSSLLRAVLERYDQVYQTVLLTDNRPETVGFYRSMGFVPDGEYGCTAFVKYTV